VLIRAAAPAARASCVGAFGASGSSGSSVCPLSAARARWFGVLAVGRPTCRGSRVERSRVVGWRASRRQLLTGRRISCGVSRPVGRRRLVAEVAGPVVRWSSRSPDLPGPAPGGGRLCDVGGWVSACCATSTPGGGVWPRSQDVPCGGRRGRPNCRGRRRAAAGCATSAGGWRRVVRRQRREVACGRGRRTCRVVVVDVARTAGTGDGRRQVVRRRWVGVGVLCDLAARGRDEGGVRRARGHGHPGDDEGPRRSAGALRANQEVRRRACPRCPRHRRPRGRRRHGASGMRRTQHRRQRRHRR